MASFTYASIPNQGIIKTRSATSSARTNELTFSVLANEAWLLCGQNVNRSYLTLKNMSSTNRLWYSYASGFVAADPTVVPFGGVAGVTIVALGVSPAYPNTGGPFQLYKKAGVAGVYTVDTNWVAVNVTAIGYFLEPQQAAILDDLQSVVIGTNAVDPALPVYIDEGSIIQSLFMLFLKQL